MKGCSSHDIAEAERLRRSFEYAKVIRERPELVLLAAEEMRMLVGRGEATLGQQLWCELLNEPLEVIIGCMTADDPDGRLLRSNNPFSILIGRKGVSGLFGSE